MAGILLTLVALRARQQQRHRQVEDPTYNRGRDAPGKTLELEIPILPTGLNTTYNVCYEPSAVATKLAEDVYSESYTFAGGTRQQPQ